MIQRIQSLYLILTSLLALLFLEGEFLRFHSNTGAEIILNFSGIWQSDKAVRLDLNLNQIPLSITMILIALISTMIIFFYKRRKLQMKLTFTLIILAVITIALLAYYAISITRNLQTDIMLTIKMFIPIMILILSVLAYKGIKKDEDLVRSYNRLR